VEDSANNPPEVLKMAVKVMVASAITKSALEQPARRPQAPGEPTRPRRRRSSVYDADGHEVFITLMCLKCHQMRPLSQFGLRKMADGSIRNQPWCRTCRSAAGTRGLPRGSAGTVDSPVAEESLAAPAIAPLADAPSGAAAEPRPAPGNIAAQIAAALAAGLGR
jgi:hypothetical protein